MKAIISLGGKQFLVQENDIINIEKIPQKPGEKFKISKILLINHNQKTSIGAPEVKKAEIEAELIETKKSKKVRILKYKPKTGYKRLKGHRQSYSKIKIDKINLL